MSVYWTPIDGVAGYVLSRDGQLVFAGSETYAEDAGVRAGNTYAYTLQTKSSDGTLSVASEPTTFTVVAGAVGSEFACGGIKGYVRLKNYANSQTRQWRIVPTAPAVIALNVRCLTGVRH